MRIDGFASAYGQPRPAPRSGQGTGASEQERALPLPPPSAPTQQGDAEQLKRRVEALSQADAKLPATLRDATLQRPISNRAQQALASYSTTEQYANDSDATSLAGLDLYA
ncbi:hypothetical protein [Atopomonas sediminilitoris]|uniref:hypothetical protein n=1 Tax=Atopomonas sediminilitoris TaxID=2919919 RepID=UPI001F4E9B7E|nr:hypothetical protein [Atopomonas sediminilitoris]MCJ8168885.1 hypothetical protein [Atopomonas sediminilitoris]